MITICAWCQTVEKTVNQGAVEDLVPATHGICKACLDKVLRELEISKLNAIWRMS